MDSPLFCANCRTLYPAEECNYFELLGFEPNYKIDEAELRRRYLHNSRDVHPDQHGGAEADAELSLRTSARLNEAYRVLADPILRAEYLLEVAGGKSSREDKTVPQEVLTQAMMLREGIEEARAAGNEDALATCRQQAERLYDRALGGIGKLAEQLPGTYQARHELRARLNAVKYYQKLLDQV